ncbi:MAG: KTSC domain-containing protein [Sterolibacterium sp.]|nr:KTSC domain-containing protein [Sterolibacterium sp.]
MERTPVTSTNIRAAGYETDSQTLEVEFNNGSVYQYAGVPLSEYEGLMNADSKGKFLNANIKGRYPYVKL